MKTDVKIILNFDINKYFSNYIWYCHLLFLPLAENVVMKVIRRLIFIIAMVGLSLLVIPLGIYWIFTGEDRLCSLMDRLVLKFFDDIW